MLCAPATAPQPVPITTSVTTVPEDLVMVLGGCLALSIFPCFSRGLSEDEGGRKGWQGVPAGCLCHWCFLTLLGTQVMTLMEPPQLRVPQLGTALQVGLSFAPCTSAQQHLWSCLQGLSLLC